MLILNDRYLTLPVRLLNAAGNPVNGVVPPDIFDPFGGGGHIHLYFYSNKAPFDVADAVIDINGGSWYPLGLGGLYSIMLFSKIVDFLGDPDISGQLLWRVAPSAALFVEYVGVAEYWAGGGARSLLDFNMDTASPPLGINTVGHGLKAMERFLNGRVKLVEGQNRRIIYDYDDVTPFTGTETKDNLGDPSTNPVYESVPVDVIPPQILFTSPFNGQVGVFPGIPSIDMNYSEDMDNTSVLAPGSFSMVDNFANVISGTLIHPFGPTVQFQLSGPLVPGRTYTCTVYNSVKDLAGNNMLANYVFSFST